jgi:hypothetical protein
MGLVFNAIFAKLVLGDPFTRKSIVGMNISSELMWSGMDRSSSSIRFLNM